MIAVAKEKKLRVPRTLKSSLNPFLTPALILSRLSPPNSGGKSEAKPVKRSAALPRSVGGPSELSQK